MSISLDLSASYKQPQTHEYAISNSMFETVENTMVKGGNLTATVTATASPTGLDLDFNIKGDAIVECDRCLDDMTVDIDKNEKLKIQFADHYEDNADVVMVEKNQKELDLWPFIYDFIVLALPIVHVHPEGQCNVEMLRELDKYMVSTTNEPDTQEL